MFISKITRGTDHVTDANGHESLQTNDAIRAFATHLGLREHPLTDALEGETREFEKESEPVDLTPDEVRELRDLLNRIDARLSAKDG